MRPQPESNAAKAAIRPTATIARLILREGTNAIEESPQNASADTGREQRPAGRLPSSASHERPLDKRAGGVGALTQFARTPARGR